MPRQVHGTDIVIVDDKTPFDPTAELQAFDADAVITQVKDRWIGVRTADCVPVLLYDPMTKTVAAVHAGWRGTVKHIVRQTVELMQSSLGVCTENLYAMIGPSISPESFEVGEEVAAEFVASGRGDCVICNGNVCYRSSMNYSKPHVDLWQSNAMDLLEVGVVLDRMDCTPLCTYQNDSVLFSARRQGIDTGRIVSAICLK